MKRFGAIVLLTMLLAGCGQAAQSAQTQTAPTQTTSNTSAAQGNSSAPKIPHKVTEGMVCKDCHAKGLNGAPVSPHPDRPNCTSCHKPQG